MIMIRDHDHHHGDGYGDEEDVNVLSCTTNYTALIAKNLRYNNTTFQRKTFYFFNLGGWVVVGWMQSLIISFHAGQPSTSSSS